MRKIIDDSFSYATEEKLGVELRREDNLKRLSVRSSKNLTY